MPPVTLSPTRVMALATIAVHLAGRLRGAHAFCAASARPLSNDLRLRHSAHTPPREAARLPPLAVGQMHDVNVARLVSQFVFFSANTRLRQQNGDGDFEPTWKYVPYQPPPPRKAGSRRKSSSSSAWTVPDRIHIPEDRLTINFVRASGAGGQNVNKVSTKVELRFHLPSADWIPAEVRDRLRENESKRINGEGYMTVTSQEHRTQLKNRKEALGKLEEILRSSWARPKVRRMRKGLSKRGKENRREAKRRNSLKKEGRKRVEF